MLGILTVFGSIGIVCASGVVVSSALRWFHSYEFDINELNKKKQNKSQKIGGVIHDKHMEELSRKIATK